jgi:ribose transport system substrate-binding protein
VRQIWKVMVVGAAGLALAACGSSSGSQEASSAASAPAESSAAPASAEPSAPAEKQVVGVSLLNLQNQYWTEIVRGIQDQAGGAVEVVVTDPKDDAVTQVSDIENFITNQVDAIVVAGIDPAALAPVIKKAQEAGIKVAAQSTKLDAYDTYVTVGELDMGTNAGEIAGQWLADNLGGKGEVAILNYPKIPQLIDRDKGIREGIAKLAPGAKVVADASAATEEEGLAAAETILQAHPNVNAFVCINDNGCMGALQAGKAAGKTSKDFAVIGIGGDPSALKEMSKDGSSYVGTVDLQSYANGKLLMESITKMLNGETIPKDQLVTLQKVVGADAAKQLRGGCARTR